jgi:myo-inositol-1(or 4)-monophosphatase
MSSQRADDARAHELLAASIAAARVAADFIAGQARHVAQLDVREKQRADFVSEVDTGAEMRIRDTLLARFPGATILGEELSPRAGDLGEIAFVVDPVDGTTNLLHGYPVYAVSIGALADGELAAGAILDVPRRELYTARRGGGAFRDGEPIRVSTTADPSRALVGTGFPFKNLDRLEEYQRQFARITRDAAGIRRAGSAALDLAHVACGRFDAFWELKLAPWDVAAGLLLIREAGGVATDLEGADIAAAHTEVAASNGALHPWLLDALR